MRKIYWYITAYIRKHGLTFFFSAIAGVIVFSVLVPIIAKKITIKDKQYIGLVGEYNLKNLPQVVKEQLSVGLTKIDQTDKTIQPLLAERWVTENEGKTYRFIIKKNVSWTDGKELTPDDINYNFNDVETISTPNDVLFKLPDKFAPFPAVVSEPILRHTAKSAFLFLKKPHVIGMGPYTLSSYEQKNNKLEELVLDGPDNRITYRFYLTEQDALLAFKKGDVDFLPDITDPRDVKNWKQIEIKERINYDQYLAVFFNNENPLFNKNVRQALAYATKKPTGKERAVGPFNPFSWAYLEGKDYAYDLDRAVERLIDGLPPEPIQLSLTTTTSFEQEAEKIKQDWQALGDSAVIACENSEDIENKDLCQNAMISVDIKITNFPDLHNFEVLLIGQEIPDDPDQYFMWHSDQATNFTNYKNTRVDSLLEKGRQTLDQQERKTAYQELQQFLLEDPPAIFLKYLKSYDIFRE